MMYKKICIAVTVFIFSMVLISSQATATSTNNSSVLHPTHINLYVGYSNTPFYLIDPVHNPYDADIYASLVDDTTGKKLGGRNIKFELISPEYGISEVKYDTTSKLSFFNNEALASFEGPFSSGVWKVRASYGGNSKDHLAPCEASAELQNIT